MENMEIMETSHVQQRKNISEYVCYLTVQTRGVPD